MKRRLVILKVWITRLVFLCTHLWNVVWPCLKYGIWKRDLCCWSPFDTVYHNKTCLDSCQGWNMQSRRCTHMCCTAMKHGLGLVKLWIMKSYVLCWSLFDAAYHHKTPFGSCQGRDKQNLRLTHLCCTSMKRSLALVKLWIMNSYCFCWFSFDISYHHNTCSGWCQGWNMQSLRFTYIFLTLNVLQFHR